MSRDKIFIKDKNEDCQKPSPSPIGMSSGGVLMYSLVAFIVGASSFSVVLVASAAKFLGG